MELSLIFKSFPLFHKWVKEKKLNTKELTILEEFENLSKIKPLLQWIETYKVTHSEGIQILEYAGELLLMNQDLNSLFQKQKKASLLIEQLKKLRHPESSSRDEEKSQMATNLNWSPSIKAKWVRKNDKGGLSVSFHSFSLRDLKQKIQNLNSIYKQLEETSDKLWKE